MLLNQTAEYALRAMSCLARAEPGVRMPSEELAREAEIPPHYVSKVMRQLVVAGLVAGQRGRSGGFVLARPLARIRFREVIDAVGGWPDVDRCAFGQAACNPDAPCPLHPTWTRLNDALIVWAETTTLADTL